MPARCDGLAPPGDAPPAAMLPSMAEKEFCAGLLTLATWVRSPPVCGLVSPVWLASGI